MFKKIGLLLLTVLWVVCFAGSVQAQELTMEELTQKVTALEAKIGMIETFFESEGVSLESYAAKIENPFVIYKMGELVEGIDRSIVMNSAELSEGILKVNFTITNTSSKQIETGGYYAFTAKNDDGDVLEDDYSSCGYSTLNMALIPGDKVKGTVCFAYAEPTPLRIYYEPDYSNDVIYIWEIDKGE